MGRIIAVVAVVAAFAFGGVSAAKHAASSVQHGIAAQARAAA